MIITIIRLINLTALSCFIVSCKSSQNGSASNEMDIKTFHNKGHWIINDMVNKVGDIKSLYDKNDVTYTYTYKTPDGKTDVSNEKYIFNGELSYGQYVRHERTLAQLDGVIEQGYNGQEYWLKHKGNILSDKDLLAKVAFSRPTNFYWFTMMQKLLDDGLIYEYLGEESKEGQQYDIIKVSFEKKNDKPTDIYQLYINKQTSLVDQFLFTVADFGKMEFPFLMILEYEEVEGISISTKRRYKQSTWNADVSDLPWIEVDWSSIRFDTGLVEKDFEK